MNKNLRGFYWGVACSKPDLSLWTKTFEVFTWNGVYTKSCFVWQVHWSYLDWSRSENNYEPWITWLWVGNKRNRWSYYPLAFNRGNFRRNTVRYLELSKKRKSLSERFDPDSGDKFISSYRLGRLRQCSWTNSHLKRRKRQYALTCTGFKIVGTNAM